MSGDKIAGLTPCLNEESTIIFTIASLLPYVDSYVVVDSGSTDKTLQLIKRIFADELRSKKLALIEYGPLEDYDISKPKNSAIEEIRRRGCKRFIRLDADDVFYDSGAKKAVDVAKNLNEEVTLYTINHWELYQNRFYDTISWLQAIGKDLEDNGDFNNPRFMCMRMPPGANPTMSGYPNRFDGSYGHARIYRTEGAVSKGKWTDEAWGKGPGEDIGHPDFRRVCIGNHDEDIVHYGWARPMDKKLAKGAIWTPENPAADPRISGIEKQWRVVNKPNISRSEYGFKFWPQSILFPFTKHPKAVKKNLENVLKEF